LKLCHVLRIALKTIFLDGYKLTCVFLWRELLTPDVPTNLLFKDLAKLKTTTKVAAADGEMKHRGDFQSCVLEAIGKMQGEGFEPTKARGHRILSPARLTSLRYPCGDNEFPVFYKFSGDFDKGSLYTLYSHKLFKLQNFFGSMPNNEWGLLQLKYQKHLEVAKIGLSGALALLGLGIAAAWYTYQPTHPAWTPKVAVVGCIGAIVVAIGSFIHFFVYLRDLNKYATALYGRRVRVVASAPKSRVHAGKNSDRLLGSFLNDTWNEILRLFCEGLGIAAITLAVLSKWTESNAPLNPLNTLLIFGAGFACLALAALLKIDIEDESRLRELQKWPKLTLIAFALIMALMIWLVIGQPHFP
jgi:hypothetical protein